MRKRVFFIPTERYSDFNSMIERYEKEMRKLFEERQRDALFEEPSVRTAAFSEKVPAALEFQQREQGFTEVPDKSESKMPPEAVSEKISDKTGKILVEVTTAKGAVPLSEATVVIDRFDDCDEKGRRELVAIETTDADGRTKPVEVKTVSGELSLEPGSKDPFATFYVTAMEKGFEPVKNRPVDVFAKEISILKIDLVPKPEKLGKGDVSEW